jgi:parallel beta-helix repeat protein
MPYKLLLSFAIAGLIGLTPAPAPAAWQDTNICDVPSADFATIQSAIDEPQCFTVRLGVATFTEQLTIHRSLTLGGQTFQHGDERFVSRLHPPSGMIDPVLIRVVGARTRVKIKHVVIAGPGDGEGLIGVWSGRDTRVSIRDCVFRNMRPPAFDSRWPFLAVYLGGPLLNPRVKGITGHTITNCTFDGYQTAAVVVEGAHTIATMEGNRMDANGPANLERPSTASAPTGVFAFSGAAVTVDRNTMVDNTRAGGGGSGVVLINAASTSVVSFNNISGNDTGIGLDGTSGTKIYRNALVGNGMGMVIGWANACNASQISNNNVEGGGTGVYLGLASSTDLSNNKFERNPVGHGIILSAGASQNTLYRNRAENNGSLGFGDASLGTRTAGTANIYTANLCSGNAGGDSWPAGLCF